MKTKMCVVLSALMLVGGLGGSNAEARDVARALREAMQHQVTMKLISFASQNMGKKIGGGQCTELVDAALAFAGAAPGSNYVWGTNVTGQRIRPGDILQFEGCRFETTNRWDEFPHHTAIVGGFSGSTVHLLHQNVNGIDSGVVATQLDLSTKTKGSIMVFRPIPR